MSPEAQRIAIAEACGWVDCLPAPHPKFDTNGGPFGRERLSCGSLTGLKTLPNYLNNLNAMHEAEKSLPDFNSLPLDQNKHRYFDHLVEVCGSIQDTVFATSAQRAEAFLRTLNLWRDTP